MEPFKNGDPIWIHFENSNRPSRAIYVGPSTTQHDRVVVEYLNGDVVTIDAVRISHCTVMYTPSVEERAWEAVRSYEAVYVQRDTKDVEPTGTDTEESTWDSIDWAYAAVLHAIIVDTMEGK